MSSSTQDPNRPPGITFPELPPVPILPAYAPITPTVEDDVSSLPSPLEMFVRQEFLETLSCIKGLDYSKYKRTLRPIELPRPMTQQKEAPYVGHMVLPRPVIDTYESPHKHTEIHDPGRREVPYSPPSYPIDKQITPALHASLWEQAESLLIHDHMTLYKDRNNPPNLQEYQLVPVLHSDPSFLSYSLSSIGSNLITSSNVRFEYDERSDGMPFLDGRITLGLAYRNRLVAVCAGGLAQEGPIIQQLQNVSSKAPPANATAKELRSFRYTNGLYNGLDWKATLVRGWFTLISRSLPEVLPDTVGMPVWIQSAENNIWVKKRVYASDQTTDNYQTDQERLMRLSRIYDGTAAKLGGTIKDPQTHNLQLPERFSVGRAA